MDVEGSLTVPSTGAEQGCDQNYHYSQPAESHSALTDETVLTMTAALLLRGAIGQQENVVLRLRIPSRCFTENSGKTSPTWKGS